MPLDNGRAAWPKAVARAEEVNSNRSRTLPLIGLKSSNLSSTAPAQKATRVPHPELPKEKEGKKRLGPIYTFLRF